MKNKIILFIIIANLFCVFFLSFKEILHYKDKYIFTFKPCEPEISFLIEIGVDDYVSIVNSYELPFLTDLTDEQALLISRHHNTTFFGKYHKGFLEKHKEEFTFITDCMFYHH